MCLCNKYICTLIRTNVGKNAFPASNVGFSKIQVQNVSNNKYFPHLASYFYTKPFCVFKIPEVPAFSTPDITRDFRGRMLAVLFAAVLLKLPVCFRRMQCKYRKTSLLAPGLDYFSNACNF